MSTVPAIPQVTIEGDEVRTESPEGVKASMKLPDLLGRIIGERIDTGELILPDGVKAVVPGNSGFVMVHQTPPRVYSFKWIKDDSPAAFGDGATYRKVRIALPYLVVLASFERGPGGGLVIDSGSECFFRNAPLKSPADELLYPALLNCSKFKQERGKPLSWICVQHLRKSRRPAEGDPSRHLEQSLANLLSHLLETGFNYSSEHHEGASWYTATVKAGVDPRIATVEAWEAATREDPLFVLEVPWVPTGRSVGDIARRVGSRQSGRRPVHATAADLARVLFHAGESEEKK